MNLLRLLAGRVIEMNGAERIAAERRRQIVEEGWTAEKDDFENDRRQLAKAAMCYCMEPAHCEDGDENAIPDEWPWERKYWKPTPGNRIRELEKAGALIAAEIDRLLRLDKKPLCPVCPELKECPHADNRTICWEYDEAVSKTEPAITLKDILKPPFEVHGGRVLYKNKEIQDASLYKEWEKFLSDALTEKWERDFGTPAWKKFFQAIENFFAAVGSIPDSVWLCFLSGLFGIILGIILCAFRLSN
jgi:hypothetical protein